MKVVALISGGVDSAVAALLLKNAGHDVTGIMMSIWDGPDSASVKKNACYGPDEKDDIEQARKVCETIGIPFHLFDCSKEYREKILTYFREEYLSARTPNPCVKCNHTMKFGTLPDAAKDSGIEFDYIATGHYVRNEFDNETKRYKIKKAYDSAKDQSYFLYRLSQQQLAQSIFPLGNLKKTQVREIAREFKLHLAEKEESQDFYGGNYKDLLGVKSISGDITLPNGKVVGSHNGFWNFTPGQRRGLGVAYKNPLYVIKVEKENNRIIVSDKDTAFSTHFVVRNLHWVSIDGINGKMDVSVKTRSSGREKNATISATNNDELLVEFSSHAETVSPGQSAVFYKDDILLGGGIVDLV